MMQKVGQRRMTTAVLVEPGRIELREVPVPEPGPGELLVRVDAALTCGTDLKTYRRGHPRIPLPAPMGHEFSGTVAAAGKGVDGFREGDAIACVPTAPCLDCRLCRRGRENLCPGAVARIVLGAFAEYVLLPRHLVEVNVFHRPSTLDPEIAAALEPLACVIHGADRTRLERAETVVFLGDGPITLLFLQIARRRGAGRILVVGRHASRLAVAAELGAEALRDPGPAALREAVLDWTGGDGADVVVECVGTPELWEAAHGLAAVGGEVLLYGGCAAGTRATFDTCRIHYDEVDLKGAFHYGRAAVRRAYELLTSDGIRVEPLITHRLPLPRLDEAIQLALSRTAIKVALRPEDRP